MICKKDFNDFLYPIHFEDSAKMCIVYPNTSSIMTKYIWMQSCHLFCRVEKINVEEK